MTERFLEKMGALVRARGIMYKVVSQLLLLYVSDSWVVTRAIIKVLEGLHHRTARWIMGMTATRGEGR